MHRFIAQLQSRWEAAKTSLWFIPAILVSITIGLSFSLLWLDRTYAEYIVTHLPWLFTGTASSAQEILSTIASSVITVVSIAFSLTIVAMQQASAQYTPRLLRNFTSDPGNQTVLGAYIATFVYSLLTLRAVRVSENGDDGFVPSISLSIAVLLALICIGLLIYFINHIAKSLQATTVISRVHQELLRQIDELYPEQIGKPAIDHKPQKNPRRKLPSYNIHSTRGGFVTQIDERSLDIIDFKGIKELQISHKVGDFVSTGEVLAVASGINEVDHSLAGKIRNAIVITDQRSITQDPLFAVRQLVDTALKGLSPGINDLTTSNYCISYLGNALGVLAMRDFPTDERMIDKQGPKLILAKPNWDDFVTDAFRQILNNAKDNAQVIEIIITTLDKLTSRLPSQQRAQAIRMIADHIADVIDLYITAPLDQTRLIGHLQHLRTALDKVPHS